MKRRRTYSKTKPQKKRKLNDDKDLGVEAKFLKNSLPSKIKEINERVSQAKKLPIKRRDGRIETKQIEIKIPPPPPIPKKSKSQKPVNQKAEPTTSLLKQMGIEKYRRHCQKEIADLCIGIQGNPEENIIFIKKLLSEFCRNEKDPEVLKMGILSISALFEDLLPMFKINLKRYGGGKLSKEVLKQRNYEEKFLSCYQNFIVFLLPKKSNRKIFTRRNPKFMNPLIKSNSSIFSGSVICICRLFLKNAKFNFSQNLSEYLVSLMVSSSTSEDLRKRIYSTFLRTFKSDKDFSVTKEIVRFVCLEIELIGHPNVSSHGLDIFLSLNLSGSVKSKKIRLKKQKHEKKFKRKKKKDKLNDHDIIASKKQQFKKSSEDSKLVGIQTDILRQVIVQYIKIIKGSSNLVFCALSGLEKFSKYINIDLVYDLLKYLGDLISSSSKTVSTVLQGLITSCCLTQGFGEAIDTDISIFYKELYNIIPIVVMNKSSGNEISQKLLIRAIYEMLIQSKQISQVRVASFVKRIATCSLQCQSNLCLVLLNFLYSLLLKYTQTQQLLRHEEIGMGEFDGFKEDPDLANPFSTTLWELTVFEKTCHPHIRIFVRRILQLFSTDPNSQNFNRNMIKKLSLEDYYEIWEKYNPKNNIFFDNEKSIKSKLVRSNQPRKRYMKSKSQSSPEDVQNLVFFKQSKLLMKNENWLNENIEFDEDDYDNE